MKTLFGLSFLGILSLAAACDDAVAPLDPTAPVPGIPDASAPVEACPAPTAGPTHHAADVTRDEVWTADGSPHLVDEDISITDDRTLTIEPCARVLVAPGKHLDVGYPGNASGHVVALGTAEKPIRVASQGAEHWARLYVRAPGTARLAHVFLENGGAGAFEDGSTLDALGDGRLPADPVFFLDHVTVAGSVGTGISMKLGATFFPGSRELTVTGSGSEANPFPVQIEEHSIDAFPTGRYTGNRIDEIALVTYGHGGAGTGLSVDATLHERGVPYRMGRTVADDFLVGSAEGLPAATLTIEPGVVMRFARRTGFLVHSSTDDVPARGAIRAIGTAAKPIVFTSAAAEPEAGDWRGLWFGGRPLATNRLDHVKIEYAGHDCACVLSTCSKAATGSEGAVIFAGQPPGAFITHTLFAAIAGHGVTQGFDGSFVDFRPTNTFEGVAGCVQTVPRPVDGECAIQPECDGM